MPEREVQRGCLFLTLECFKITIKPTLKAETVGLALDLAVAGFVTSLLGTIVEKLQLEWSKALNLLGIVRDK